jgi:hypothetical protein
MPYQPPQAKSQPAAWQAQPQPVVRGVSGDAAPARFVLSRPEVLGVQAQPAQMDWAAIQQRLDRLGVVRYRKNPVAGGVCVTLHLPTANPGMVQPVEASADSEGAAALLALQAAETWQQNQARGGR